MRVGIYATASSTREQAGASFWGILELSGSMWERPVVLHLTGLNFAGLHGNGVLSSDGKADVSNWPLVGGVRGGNWFDPSEYARVSDRTWYTSEDPTGRYQYFGGRAVRSAPSGVEP